MKVHQFLVCLFVIVSAGLLFGQGGANGTILGTVTDNSGAVVANARVDVTNVATSVTSHSQTSSEGNFTVPYLAPGAYRVTVEAPGFQKAVAENIVLAVAQQARVNVSMKRARFRRAWKCKPMPSPWIPTARRFHNLSARSRWSSCRSTAATSLTCCSSARAPCRLPANRARCDREKETPSALTAVDLPPTTTRWMDWSTPILP